MFIFSLIFLLCFSLVFGQDVPVAAQAPVPAQNQPQAKSPGADINHLLGRPECSADIQKYCKKQIQMTPKEQLSDMTVLECLQDAGYSDAETLTPGCEQAVWEVKVALTADDRFHNAVVQFCANETRQFTQLRPCLDETKPGHSLSFLECLQDAGYSDTETLTLGCEQAVWEVKVALTADDRFHNAVVQFCANETRQFTQLRPCLDETKPGHALSCMLDHVLQLPKTGQCFQFLARIQSIAFTDFRLVGTFVEKCGEYVAKLGCGTLTRNSAHKGAKVPHSQGATLECFIDKLVNMPKEHEATLKSVSNECRHEVMRIAELQSDDWHLDRPLFFACRQDRERFCSEIPAGDGKVFQCLLEHRTDKFMEPSCSKILSERAGLMGQDAHLAHPLTNSCQNEMKEYQCNLQPGYQSSVNFHLSWLLLCLENSLHNYNAQQHDLSKGKQLLPGQKKLTSFNQQCQHEMINHRSFMVQEFKMSPELVMGCAQEIDKFCSPNGDIEKNGLTIHCLMEHAQMRDERFQISSQCMGTLQHLMKVADIGTNYQVDKVLYSSCKTLIEGKCKMDSGSEAGVLTCLMKYVDTDDMTNDCEQRLVEVQYFLARDWTLDTNLYESCHKEAVERCSAFDNWHLQNNPENKIDPGPSVLACLYRAAYDEKKPLTKECSMNIHRILRERAIRVNLLPEIEDNCRDALSEYCSNQVQPQEEMNCLQENFETKEFKKKYSNCYKELEKFTLMESKDTKLNRLLTRACRPVIDTYCSNLINEEIDHGDVMECLSRNKDKQEMTPKCKSYVNHFELISMRDYHFNYRFSKACDDDIKKHCSAFGQDKGAVIRCLSNIMFEHRILGETPDLAKDCKKQLRVAYLQQEQVDLDFDDKKHMVDADPTLMRKCENDIRKLDCKRKNTFEEIVECLREGFDTLEPDCKAVLFDREKIQAMDNTFDDELMRLCQFDLKKFCSSTTEGDSAIKCLSNTKIIRVLQPTCQKIVRERLREQSRDDRLRPGFLKVCEQDAKQHCNEEYKKIHLKEYSEQQLGAVISACLRQQLARFDIRLQPQCKEELSNIILEAEFDVQTDPMLYKACKDTINRHCSNKIVKEGGRFDTVLECLKADFYTSQIQDQNCAKELARITQEALVDIHLDPSLFEACSVDVRRICNDVPPGQSRVISCLMDALEVPRVQMSDQCKTKLSERKKLWNVAHEKYKMEFPKTLSGIYNLVAEHPERDSILAWFGGLILIILIVGCCCGRCTKRTAYELKNK
uniref:Golgi apparatus protein 1 n=1 Tax=Panagrolaimus sp. JU765 TaxID=591449 RepID=A0AC34Q7S5_9BILA